MITADEIYDESPASPDVVPHKKIKLESSGAQGMIWDGSAKNQLVPTKGELCAAAAVFVVYHDTRSVEIR